MFDNIKKMFKTNILGISNKKNKIKILIDAGHGIDTPGKRSPYSMTGLEPSIEFYEWIWNRDIAYGIVERLKSMNYNAELLVTEENDISLSERVKRVNDYCKKLGEENVMLISIHSNAAGNGKKWEKAQGWEAYTSIGKTGSDDLAVIFYDCAKEMFPNRRIRCDWTDNDSDKENNFYMLKKTKCVAILTENFFYDNIDDVKFIISNEGREQIISLHVIAIEKYLDK